MDEDMFTSTEKEFADNKNSDERNSCQCKCHFVDSNCSYDLTVAESLKFRELLFLHLDIIDEQNSKLENKEKKIQQLKAENDQLNARLNRMERRVALKMRKSTEEADTELMKQKSVSQKGYITNQRNCHLVRQKAIGKCRKTSSYASGVIVTSRHFKSYGTGIFLRTDYSYLHSEGYSSYCNFNRNARSAKIPVPCWKDISARISSDVVYQQALDNVDLSSNDERTDDDSYLRRHSKMEADEIRRKRWDIQQLRQEKMQENLKQRQKGQDDNRKNAKVLHKNEMVLNSLNPASKNVMAIEIADDVPVLAFGSRIPRIESSEFELPWFDMGKKEIQYRQRNFKVARRQKRKVFYKA